MLITIAISLVYVEIKESVVKKLLSQVVKKFWNEWELRLMVIASLILQFQLVYLGRKRKKYTGRNVPVIAISAWLIYLLADWTATLVLSTLLRGAVELEHGFIVFWTPFLLWHLGSAHNVTAYSLEDNELWLRHFLGMVFQVGEAVYICIRFWSNTTTSAVTMLELMAIPLLIAGVFKYGERIWALRCASPKQLINFFYTTTTTTSSTSTSHSKQQQGQGQGRGLRVNVVGKRKAEMVRTGLFDRPEKKGFLSEQNMSEEVKFLREAHCSFDVFKPMFADLPIQIVHTFHDEMVYLSLYTSAVEAFNFVGIELGFLYDLLFTKIPIHHSSHGSTLILHGVCFLILVAEMIIVAFVVFLHKTTTTSTTKHSSSFSNTDIMITFLLLSGAIFLEIDSFSMYCTSKWTMMRYGIPKAKGNINKLLNNLYCRLIGRRLRSIKEGKGIRNMAQHDLIDYYVKAEARGRFNEVIKLIDTVNLLQRFGHTKWKPVDDELKDFIYSHLKEKRPELESELEGEGELGFKLHELLGQRMGDNVIEKNGFSLEEGYWKMESTDFTRRIFVWHIATGLVYYDDLYRHRIADSKHVRIGKSLSDYMMYLVLVRPSMLPNGFSEMVNRETNHQAQRFSPKEGMRNAPKHKLSTKEFVAALLTMPGENNDSSVCIETGALLDGQKFAKQLQGLVREDEWRWDDDDKWKMISEVWMEMMVFAASRCTWEEHAQQLRHGGELLTHVSLLMAHLGLSTQVHRLKLSFDDDHDHDDQAGSLQVI